MKRPVKIEFNPRWINAPVGVHYMTHPTVDLGIILETRMEEKSNDAIPPILITFDDNTTMEVFPVTASGPPTFTFVK